MRGFRRVEKFLKKIVDLKIKSTITVVIMKLKDSIKVEQEFLSAKNLAGTYCCVGLRMC